MSAPRAAGLLAAALAGACGAVPEDAGFEEVRGVVAERTGHRVHWSRGGPEDRAVAEEVRAMLAEPLSPEVAVQVALLGNRRLQATYEDLAVAQADLVRAGLLSNPVFDAEVRFPEGGGGPGLDAAVVTEFLDVLRIPLREKVAAARFEAAKASVARAVLDLAHDARAAAIELVAARQLLELRATVLEATEASHELARRLHAAGNVTDLVLAVEHAQLEGAKLEVAAAEADVLALRERLNVLLGLWGPDAARWSPIERLPPVPVEEGSAADAVHAALERSLALEASARRVDEVGTRLGVQRASRLVRELELGVAAELEHEDDAWSVGPAVAVPLPLFDRGRADVAAAEAEVRRALADHHATAVELRAAVRAAVGRVRSARARAAHLERVVLPLRARVLDETQLQYNAMQVGAFELLRARERQVEAGAELVEAQRDYWLARAALDTLVAGGGGEPELVRPSGGRAGGRDQEAAAGH